MSKKRTVYTDGWHEKNEYLSFYVEAGYLMCGVRSDGCGGAVTVYPYQPSPYGGLDKVCPKAKYGILNRIEWH